MVRREAATVIVSGMFAVTAAQASPEDPLAALRLLRQRDTMWDCALHKAEAFHSTAWFPGKRDHKSMIDHSRKITRENRVGRDLHRLGAHHFSKARHLHTHDRADRFRCDIARANAGAASSEDQAAALF